MHSSRVPFLKSLNIVLYSRTLIKIAVAIPALAQRETIYPPPDDRYIPLVRMRRRLSTPDGKDAFEYEHTEDGTITIFYGDACEYSLVLESPLYDRLVTTFGGKTVRLNHCLARENVEDWLKANGIYRRITQYLAPVLYHEQVAVEGPRTGTITFR